MGSEDGWTWGKSGAATGGNADNWTHFLILCSPLFMTGGAFVNAGVIQHPLQERSTSKTGQRVRRKCCGRKGLGKPHLRQAVAQPAGDGGFSPCFAASAGADLQYP